MFQKTRVMGTVLSAVLMAATPAVADRFAHVVVPSDGSGEEGAIRMSRALLGAGYVSNRHTMPVSGQLRLTAARSELGLVYVAGPVTDMQAREIHAAASRLARTGTANLLLVFEQCEPDLRGEHEDATLTADPRVVLIHAGSEPDCAPGGLADDLISALDAVGEPFRDIFPASDGSGVMIGELDLPLVAGQAKLAPAPVVIGGGSGNGVIVASSIRPVGSSREMTGTAISGGGARLVPAAISSGQRSGGLRIGPALSALLEARETPEGLPRPSIIVGVIRRDNEAAENDAVAEGALPGAALAVDTFDARERMRNADPDGFAGLVETGAFDPEPGTEAVVLQTALQRMGCYRLAIDGDWGNGSRNAVDLYYRMRGDTPPTREASVDLFRDVILREDVDCPAPVIARDTPQRQTTTRTSSRQTAGSQRQVAPRRADPPAPARSEPSSGQRLNPTLGGVFR
ncbi:peptidoglycan-binding domain-containing protein [Jannaschia aquimarina]|uniref:peptidoglycan-binding domain-containing protein n=1 Tax=Jannaschia aquimarina TaxID=935700 RepID=UPI00113167F9|nr:hypothetical protein [Jannaschia aquimarina]